MQVGILEIAEQEILRWRALWFHGKGEAEDVGGEGQGLVVIMPGQGPDAHMVTEEVSFLFVGEEDEEGEIPVEATDEGRSFSPECPGDQGRNIVGWIGPQRMDG